MVTASSARRLALVAGAVAQGVGVVFGVLSILLTPLGIVIVLVDAGFGHKIDFHDVEAGDCFTPTWTGPHWMAFLAVENPLRVSVVPCDRPHEYEAFHVFDLASEDEYSVEDVFADLALGACTERLPKHVGDGADESQLGVVVYPREDDWIRGDDRRVVCAVVTRKAEDFPDALGREAPGGGGRDVGGDRARPGGR